MPLKLAPSPPVTYRYPSGPKASAPPAWLGNCWHHSPFAPSPMRFRRLAGLATFDVRLTVYRSSLLRTVQPSVVAPGGLGQASFQTGAV